MPARIYRKARRVAQNHNFWPIVQVTATLVAILAVGYIVFLVSKEGAARAARTDSDNRAAVQSCFDRNAQGPAAQRFFNVLTVILENQKILAGAGLTATNNGPRTVEQFQDVRKRATASILDLNSFEDLSKTNTPTRQECVALAKKLEVRLPSS